MADPQVPRQLVRHPLRKNFTDKPHPLRRADLPAIADDNSRPFLTAVLKREKSVINQLRRIRDAIDTEKTAKLPRSIIITVVICSIHHFNIPVPIKYVRTI